MRPITEVQTIWDVWDAWGSGDHTIDSCVYYATGIVLSGIQNPERHRRSLSEVFRAALHFGMHRHIFGMEFGENFKWSDLNEYTTRVDFHLRDVFARLRGRLSIEVSRQGVYERVIVRIEGPRGGRKVEHGGRDISTVLREALMRAKWLQWWGIPSEGS